MDIVPTQDKELFQNLIECSHDIVGLIDVQGNILYSSPSLKEVLGYTPEELSGKNAFSFLIHPADLHVTQSKFGLLLQNPKQPQIAEFRLHHKDGTWRWMEGIGTNLLDNPHVHGILINYHDITDKKLNERYFNEMRQEKAKDEAILDCIGDGMFATDKTGQIILFNKAAEEMLGVEAKDVIGKLYFTVIPAETQSGEVPPDNERMTMSAMRLGQKKSGVFYYFRKDHTKFPVATTAAPTIFNREIVGSITIFRDITKEKELEKAKDDFVLLASHQLRTPMTAIKGFLSMIIGGDYGEVPEKMAKPLHEIANASERMIALINNILNISRIESGRTPFMFTDFDVTEVVRAVQSSLLALARQKNIEFLVADSQPLSVQADADKVRQILENLIGNAIKFTDKGSVNVSFQTEGDFIKILVSDTGVGIPPEDHEKLFNKFQQLSSNQTGQSSGTGLGLYISQQLTQKMGGDLHLSQSVLNKGTTFVISLPVSDSNTARQTAQRLSREG